MKVAGWENENNKGLSIHKIASILNSMLLTNDSCTHTQTHMYTHTSVLSHLLNFILNVSYVLRILTLAPCHAVTLFTVYCVLLILLWVLFFQIFHDVVKNLTLLCDFSHYF